MLRQPGQQKPALRMDFGLPPLAVNSESRVPSRQVRRRRYLCARPFKWGDQPLTIGPATAIGRKAYGLHA